MVDRRQGWHRLFWNDYNAVASSLGGLGATNPDPIVLFGAGGIKGLAFDGVATTEELFGANEMLHDYAEGLSIRFHVHWMPTTAAAGSVVWQLEYSICRVNEVATAPTIISVSDAAAGAAWTHQKIGFSALLGTNIQIGDHFMYRIFRDPTDSADDYAADAVLISLGAHVRVNSPGSRQELIK